MAWGGAREGAGRPPRDETPSKVYPRLPKFETDAIKSLRHRVPPGTHPVAAEVADYAFKRVVDVLNEDVDPEMAPTVLKAATMIRDEVCGPIVKKVEVKMGLAEMLALAAQDDGDVVDALPPDGDVVEDADLFPDPESRHEKALAPNSGPGPGAEDED